MYIYIYREREVNVYICIYICVHIYIIYIYSAPIEHGTEALPKSQEAVGLEGLGVMPVAVPGLRISLAFGRDVAYTAVLKPVLTICLSLFTTAHSPILGGRLEGNQLTLGWPTKAPNSDATLAVHISTPY